MLYNSSVGKKLTMSLTGLFLCTFLIEHLVGNLLLLPFLGDATGRAYDSYTEMMASNPIIRTIEFVLFASIFGHAISGVAVWWKNRKARPQKYGEYRLQDNTPLASRITMITGSTVLLFLVVHLRTFFVPMRFGGAHSGYALVVEAFYNQWYSLFYILALLLLGYHLRHGFQSAFQTLGLRNKKYFGLIDFIAVLFWFVIPLGFAIIPMYFLFIHKNIAAL